MRLAREEVTLFTDSAPNELREAIQWQDSRKSVTELMQQRERSRLQRLLQRGRDYYRRLREKAVGDTQERQKVRSRTYGR